MFGGSLVGNAFSAAVAALAAVHAGSPDPTVWLIGLAGPFAGTVMVSLILLLSIPAICLLVYFVASAARQIGPLARTPWSWLVALSVSPLALVALNTAWTLDHVVTVASFGTLVFFSVCGIVAADFWLLRRGSIRIDQFYVAGPGGCYWYWGGVNWVAMAVIALGVAGYLYLYDPVTLEIRTAFRYLGAALPVIAGSALLYYVLMELVRIAGALPSRPTGVTDAPLVKVGL
jgi:hypothetical protein